MFSIILIIISWYFKKHISDLELVFSEANRQNLHQMAISFAVLGIIGAVLGLFIPTKVTALFFVSFALVISAIFSIRLAKKMK